MRLGALLMIAALAAASTSGAQAAAPSQSGVSGSAPQVPKRLVKIMAKRDGRSCANGYKVRNIREEYQILAVLELQPRTQSLVTGKKPCDLQTAFDPKTGQEREVWFDISAFFYRF